MERSSHLPLNPSEILQRFPVRQHGVFHCLNELRLELCGRETEGNTEVSNQNSTREITADHYAKNLPPLCKLCRLARSFFD